MVLPDPDFRIVSPVAAPLCVVKACGEIDAHSSQHLKAILRHALAADPAKIVIDLEDVTFMDCSGLGVLVGATKQGRERDIELLLRAPSQCVHRLLEITRLNTTLPVENGAHPAQR